MKPVFARAGRSGLSVQDKAAFASLLEASRRADRQDSWLPPLERSYRDHAHAFGYALAQLQQAALHGLTGPQDTQAALDLAEKAAAEPAADIDWKRDLALVLEQQGRFETALLIRESIHAQARTAENSFALGRLRERLGAGADIHACYARLFDQSPNNFLLALARRKALSAPGDDETPALAVAARQIRAAVANFPDDVALQLALGFIQMSEGDREQARQSFLRASVFADRKAGLTALPAAGRPQHLDVDPWSLGYAQGCLLEPDHCGLRQAVFHAQDPLRIAIVAARGLRESGDPLGALSQYEAALRQLHPRLPAFDVIRYNGFTILHYQNRYLAVPPRYGWLFARSFSQQLRLMAPRSSRRFALARRMLHLARRLALAAVRLPPVRFLLRLAYRPARATARRLAPYLGVLADVDLGRLKTRIDRIDADKGQRPVPSERHSN